MSDMITPILVCGLALIIGLAAGAILIDRLYRADNTRLADTIVSLEEDLMVRTGERDAARRDAVHSLRERDQNKLWLTAARADNTRLTDGISALVVRYELEGTTGTLRAAADLRPLLTPASEEKALTEALTAEADTAAIEGGPLLDRISDLVDDVTGGTK